MNTVKNIVLAAAASLLMWGSTQAYAAGCSVLGGWPGAQYGLQAQILTDSLPCYGITGTKNSPVVLGTAPTITAPMTVTGANALALAVGRQGITNPAFTVDTTSGGTTINGISVIGGATGNGVNISAIGGDAAIPIIVNAVGSGTISLNPSGTGSINLYRNTFILNDTNPTLTLGVSGGSLAHISTPGTSGLAFTSNGNDQVKILDTPSANRQITMTGSNGGNPTLATTAGSLAITPAVVGAAGINGSMAGSSIKCNSSPTPATSTDCSAPLAQAVLGQGIISFGVTGVNANSANTDTPITITLPTGYTKYRMQGVFSYNPSTSLTTATAGVFTGAGGTGTTVVTSAALSSLTTNTAGSSGSLFAHPVVNVNAAFFNSATLFYRIGSAQGSAATVDVLIQIVPLL
jgi:hypothetical protein